jgi:hypothetical protein
MVERRQTNANHEGIRRVLEIRRPDRVSVDRSAPQSREFVPMKIPLGANEEIPSLF